MQRPESDESEHSASRCFPCCSSSSRSNGGDRKNGRGWVADKDESYHEIVDGEEEDDEADSNEQEEQEEDDELVQAMSSAF